MTREQIIVTNIVASKPSISKFHLASMLANRMARPGENPMKHMRTAMTIVESMIQDTTIIIGQ